MWTENTLAPTFNPEKSFDARVQQTANVNLDCFRRLRASRSATAVQENAIVAEWRGEKVLSSGVTEFRLEK
jgi:hypothetical protein